MKFKIRGNCIIIESKCVVSVSFIILFEYVVSWYFYVVTNLYAVDISWSYQMRGMNKSIYQISRCKEKIFWMVKKDERKLMKIK